MIAKIKRAGTVIAASILASASVAKSANSNVGASLVVDGGFETPIVTTQDELDAGYVTQNVGSSFGGPSNNAWTVVQQGGGSNNIVIGPTTQYVNGGVGGKQYYNGNSGLQYIDLTGTGDNGVKMGIQQTLATTPSQSYIVTFFVGRDSSSGIASTELDVNGTPVGTYSNSNLSGFPPYNGDGVALNSWESFSYDFTASSASTTVGFYNLSASGVIVNDLDDVSVSAVPEPTCLGLLGIGAVATLGRRRRLPVG